MTTKAEEETCKKFCGEMGKHGYHSILCPLSMVDMTRVFQKKSERES